MDKNLPPIRQPSQSETSVRWWQHHAVRILSFQQEQAGWSELTVTFMRAKYRLR